MEKVTAAVLITRREATAEASLARRRDLRKLGTAIAAIIRITATTSSNSIKENPLRLRMNTPQASAYVGGRGPGGVRPTRNPSSQDTSSHAGDSIPNRWGSESNTFVAPPGTRGSWEEDSAWRGGSMQLLSSAGARTCVFRAWRGQARDRVLRVKRFEWGVVPGTRVEMERILEKSKGRKGARFVLKQE